MLSCTGGYAGPCRWILRIDSRPSRRRAAIVWGAGVDSLTKIPTENPDLKSRKIPNGKIPENPERKIPTKIPAKSRAVGIPTRGPELHVGEFIPYKG